MNANRLFWGILLITFGVLLLLGQLDVITFSIWSIISFWPIVLILIGISLLKIGDKAKVVSALVISAAVIIISLCIDTRPSFVKFFDEVRFYKMHNSYHTSNDDMDWDEYVKSTQQETIDFAEVKSGKLELVCAAGEYDIKGDANFAADTANSFLYSFTYPQYFQHEFSSNNVNGLKMVSISPLTDSRVIPDDKELDLILNSYIPWAIDIESGASSIDADFTAVNLTNLVLSGGASSVDIKLGYIAPICNVEIETGVSKVEIKVPKEAGCKIDSKMGLSSMSTKGFNNGVTPNYDTAEKKINITLSAGVSKVSIERY